MDKLILFDCDGTLVDSEHLYNSITAELLQGLGFEEYTTERCIELFAGQAWSMIKSTLEAKHGAVIPADIVQRYIHVANQKMDTDLHVPKGVYDLLAFAHAHYQICVASNGERNNVIKSLHITDLKPFFPDAHIFTKIQVEQPKPAPDLFLFAADCMGFTADKCVVIEDSPAGVEAGVTAGMYVIGFTGCAHDSARQAAMLKDAGAHQVFDSMCAVQSALETHS